MSQNTESFSNAHRAYVDVLQGASQQSANYVLPHVEASGCIKEYTPVGDGVHLPAPQQLHLMPLPLIERTRPRSHTLVRKVTVVGSHVLRYVSRNSNLFVRRHVRQNIQRTRLVRIDPHVNFGSAFNYDQEDWLPNDYQQPISTPSLLQLQLEPSAQNIMLQSNSENSSLLGWFNWKIYLGMICIIVAQALLKLSFQEIYNMS